MRLALDYDQTYTVDPEFWDAFMANAQVRGHEIICVTMRGPQAKVPMNCPIVYTSGEAKVPFCEQHGIKVDVWIDDQPYRLVEGAVAN